MDGLVSNNSSNSTVVCDIEANLNFRLAMLSLGSLTALVGCVCNLFLFGALLGVRTHVFQCALAFLDFAMCALFIEVFGLLRFSQVFEIQWLYDGIYKNYLFTILLSRIVQMTIPYILIAVSAERLAQISGKANWNSRGSARLITCGLIVVATTLLRAPIYFTLEVNTNAGCTDYFNSKTLVPSTFAHDVVWTRIDIVQQFVNLFVTFVVLCFLNLLIIRKLRQSHRRARRQSACASVTFTVASKLHGSVKSVLDDEARREAKRLRCAIRTTTVIISSYLACNAINFVLYLVEQLLSDWIFDTTLNQFYPSYIFASDLGTNLFVFSSAIRIFIYYKYNPEIRNQIRRSLPFLNTERPLRHKASKDLPLLINGNKDEKVPLQTRRIVFD